MSSGWRHICIMSLLLCIYFTSVAKIKDNQRFASDYAYEEYAPSPNLYNRVKSKITGYVTPKMFGAKGDGNTDDTTPIQYSINYAAAHGIGEVRIPSGTYRVNISGHNKDGTVLLIDGEPHFFDLIGAGLILKSGVNLVMDENTILQAVPTNQAEYAVLYIGEQKNITIKGGKIKGDYPDHTGDKGQQGMCIWIQSSSNITVEGCDISHGWGDCIDIGCKWRNTISYGSNRSEKITIKNCALHNSRRQGISVVGCQGLLVKDCKIYDIAGDAPQAGVDLEVNFKDYPNTNCVFDNVTINNCKGGGVIGYTTPSHNVEIRNSTIQSVQFNCVNNIKIVNSKIGYATFDNYYEASKDTVAISGSTIKTIILYSTARYQLIIDNCTLDGAEDQPALAFVKRATDENKNGVVGISVRNSSFSATHNVNLFSISPSVYPKSIELFNTSISQYKPTSFFANSIILNQCKLTGRSLTMDFHAPNVSFVDNMIDAGNCLENINGYLFKFLSEKKVVFTGNELKGEKKEGQFVVIPNEYAPECEIANNIAQQYNRIATYGKKTKVRMNNNRLSGIVY